MQLIITKENEYLELEDTVVIKANEFGVWFGKIFTAQMLGKYQNQLILAHIQIYMKILKVRNEK